jgi:hypothetical protein
MSYDWFCKKLPTVKKATYDSAHGASRPCVRQIVDIRLHFGYLLVPVIEHSHVFGDNKSMIKRAIRFDAILQERYVALSFNREKEGMASDRMTLAHILSHENAPDVLSKWQSLQTLLLVWRYNGMLYHRKWCLLIQLMMLVGETDLI